jgi:HEPN domain-containing protein
MSKAERIDDAMERLYAAESRLKQHDYAGAMYEAQRCIELSVKALLDKLCARAFWFIMMTILGSTGRVLRN